jgi:hypothetical protein
VIDKDCENFQDGVTYALALLGQLLRVAPITIRNGTEDFDGDVLSTIDGIIRESLGDDEADRLVELVRKRPELQQSN